MSTLLIGTTKGLFLLRPDTGRSRWSVSGPHCDGWPINHAIASPDGRQIWAAGGSDWHGAGVWTSQDGGTSWALAKLSNGGFDRMLTDDPDMAGYFNLPAPTPAPFTGKVSALWSLGRAGRRLLAGGKPGVLFQSDDDGATWAEVASLNDHPSRDSWQPGGAGLILHSIVTAEDAPERLWLGISAAGVFASEDGGATWDRRNRASNAGAIHDHAASPDHDHAPHHDPHHDHAADEVGLCVHNFTRARAPGDLIYQQNHHGVFRSADGGRSWTDISAGLPSRFGFPIAVHPEDPQTIWVLPLNGDTQGRFPPDASCAIWRSRNGGESWERLSDGLPQTACFFTVLRQSMAVAPAQTAGKAALYFGTNSGSVFATQDDGDHWDEIARHLPTILSVETAA